MVFQFKCSSCGLIQDEYVHSHSDLETPNCPACNQLMRRYYKNTVSGIHMFEERYHAGIGAHVKSKADLHDAMHRKEADYYARRGEVIKFEEP